MADNIEETPRSNSSKSPSGNAHGVAGPEHGLSVSRDYVADLLSELGEIATSSGLGSIAREVRDERLPALHSGRMSLVVLGEFNHGKSTVVNALLGENVLPVGITPTTAVITHLVYGEQRSVRIKPPRGEAAIEIEYDGMEAAIRHAADDGKEPEYVEISYPNEILSDSLVLVDTPGVNDISRQKVEITYGYVPRADVILYVLDATQVLKKSEVSFIRDRLLKANRNRIIFVLGKVDALSADEAREVEEYARQRLAALIGPVELYAFSARRALEAQLKGEAAPEEFERFRQSMFAFLRENKSLIIIDSALGGALRIAGVLEQNLAIKRQGYTLHREDLQRRIDAVHQKLRESRKLIAENVDRIEEGIGGIAATARHNLRAFSDNFAESLPLQIERAEAKDVKRYLPVWIQDTFKQWLESEGQEVASSLEELAEEIIEITNESLRDIVGTLREEMGLKRDLDLEIDTIRYDVSVFALGTLGVSVFLFANALVGGLLTLATPVLAVFLKGKVDEKLKERARDEGVKAISAASAIIEDELLRVIHDYGDRLKNFIETAGDRLYSQIEEALEQVQRETKGELPEADRERLVSEVDAHLKSVRRVAKMIKTSREKLTLS
ncbi:MAG: dynamin family protein [Bradymonadaceae bacterium]|nr:dynamin family protein [Lujinxingiaceae bacterium]